MSRRVLVALMPLWGLAACAAPPGNYPTLAHRAADAAELNAASAAERSASGAGGPGSEGWVQGQQALSAAQAARVRTTRALGDIDAIAAASLQNTGGMQAGDLIAVQQAAAAVADIDRRQAERLKAIQARLGG